MEGTSSLSQFMLLILALGTFLITQDGTVMGRQAASLRHRTMQEDAHTNKGLSMETQPLAAKGRALNGSSRRPISY